MWGSDEPGDLLLPQTAGKHSLNTHNFIVFLLCCCLVNFWNLHFYPDVYVSCLLDLYLLDYKCV